MLDYLLLGVAIAAIAWLASFLIGRAAKRARIVRDLRIATLNGIDETLFVSLGGIDQCLSIRGEDRANPIVIVLHGGMAMSYMALAPLFRSWESHVTIVQWDRRGVGKTFGRNGRKRSGEMRLERIIADGLELAEYLRQRFPERKLILFGHSMGSMIGVSMAAARPDLFAAYVGCEQIISMARNEAVSYEMMRSHMQATGDAKSLAKLDRIGPPPYSALRRWGVKQDLVRAVDPTYARLFKEQLRPLLGNSPAYNFGDFIAFIGGNIFSGAKLYEQWMAFDAAKLGARFRLPVFIVQGETDVMTPTRLAAEWLDTIEAPEKKLIAVPGVGHLAMFAAPDAYRQILVEQILPLTADRRG